MATPAEVAQFRTVQRDLVTLALAALARWWAGLDLRSAAEARSAVPAMVAFTGGLTRMYGESAALAAADWYEELRSQAGVRGRFRARMADPAPREQVEAVTRWAAGPLFTERPDPAPVLRNLSGGVQRLVLQPARETVADSVEADPADARWARVPSGAKTCAFCRLLASRGAVYHSEESAGGLARSYHGLCDCVPTPVWPGEEEPYDVDALLEEYTEARAKAGGNPKAILAQMRADLGIN
ncbi:hypothetical protein CSH63_17885 [Micromonospora tulbaghiae]|uniref:Capsid maturation protease n=1 Tax=Micromonospora tulbaghiae TaxID=479978 RepID=A0A386WM62_9ACTN|nr:hypothetical protein [Micromonospora tulbaghiae]AYF29301.1 hypothetical protein CSH63_17885 [Micromonospora tulbaghiae]